MQEILVYSDSLTWGIIPNTRQHLPGVEKIAAATTSMIDGVHLDADQHAHRWAARSL